MEATTEEERELEVTRAIAVSRTNMEYFVKFDRESGVLVLFDMAGYLRRRDRGERVWNAGRSFKTIGWPSRLRRPQ